MDKNSRIQRNKWDSRYRAFIFMILGFFLMINYQNCTGPGDAVVAKPVDNVSTGSSAANN